jgi:hypothetical protein
LLFVLSDFRLNISQLRASDFGVVFGIMMLELELELTNYLSAMVAKLSELTGIRPRAINCDGPDISSEAELRDMMEPSEEHIIKDAISKISKRKSTKSAPKKLEHQFMVSEFTFF